MNNNPNSMMQQMFNMFSQAQNPMAMMNQMMGNNPFFQQAVRMAEGKTPVQMKEIISNVAQQMGISQEQLSGFARMFGMNF